MKKCIEVALLFGLAYLAIRFLAGCSHPTTTHYYTVTIKATTADGKTQAKQVVLAVNE